MSRSIGVLLLALVSACASTVLASAQALLSQTEIANSSLASTSPVAYIYVSSSAGQGQINGYAAASDGSLTAVAGSPFPGSVSAMATNGRWLYGADYGNIDSFSVASNGAITFAGTVSVPGDEVVNLFFDHTGTWLYVNDYDGAYNNYFSYSIDQSTGQLAFINEAGGGPLNNGVLSFIGNSEFAYSSTCADTAMIFEVQRASDGSIIEFNTGAPLPTIPPGYSYCPGFAAADPTDHLAIAVQAMNANGGVAGPYQLATYTADSSGNLTTNSTYQNMLSVRVGSVSDYWMSPNGRCLAVAGFGGLQLFHFNGANPITKFTGLLTSNAVWQVFWDNSSHLYALSVLAGELYVFTVTSKGVKQAPGSPYAIAGAQNLVVLPKT